MKLIKQVLSLGGMLAILLFYFVHNIHKVQSKETLTSVLCLMGLFLSGIHYNYLDKAIGELQVSGWLNIKFRAMNYTGSLSFLLLTVFLLQLLVSSLFNAPEVFEISSYFFMFVLLGIAYLFFSVPLLRMKHV